MNKGALEAFWLWGDLEVLWCIGVEVEGYVTLGALGTQGLWNFWGVLG